MCSNRALSREGLGKRWREPQGALFAGSLTIQSIGNPVLPCVESGECTARPMTVCQSSEIPDRPGNGPAGSAGPPMTPRLLCCLDTAGGRH